MFNKTSGASLTNVSAEISKPNKDHVAIKVYSGGDTMHVLQCLHHTEHMITVRYIEQGKKAIKLQLPGRQLRRLSDLIDTGNESVYVSVIVGLMWYVKYCFGLTLEDKPASPYTTLLQELMGLISND